MCVRRCMITGRNINHKYKMFATRFTSQTNLLRVLQTAYKNAIRKLGLFN